MGTSSTRVRSIPYSIAWRGRAGLKRTDKVVDGKLRKYYLITRTGRAQKRRLMELISEALTVEDLSRVLDHRRKREEAKRRLA